jgi:hypothetical protein
MLADRQRVVTVGAVPERLLHESMARDPPHRVEDARVGDAAPGELLLDHALSLPDRARLLPARPRSDRPATRHRLTCAPRPRTSRRYCTSKSFRPRKAG